MKKLTMTILIGAALILGITGLIGGKSADEPIANNEPPMSVVKSGVLAEVTYDDLLQDASVIVEAHTTNISEAFSIQSVNGAVSNFTDYTLQADKVLKGALDENETFTVRLEGGTVDGQKVVVEEAPQLPVDESVLLFLYQPNMGGGFNTEGNYYYVLGMMQGVFYPEKDADEKTYAESNNTFTNGLGTSISIQTLENDLSNLQQTVSGNNMNENRVYEAFLENQKKNLESGFITQEEYEKGLNESKQYATIVKD